MPSTDDWVPQMSSVRNHYEGRIRTWNNTPSFGTVPLEQRPVNGYSDQRLKADNSPFREILWQKTGSTYVVLSDTTYHRDLNGVYGFVNWHKSAVDAAFASELVGIEDRVDLKAILKVADAKVNIGVALAEARKTSDLIYGTARRIDRAYRALRKGRLLDVARELNITPSRVHKNWLEYKYGWLPLLMDVRGAAEFFAQQYLTRPLRFKVQAREVVTKTYNMGEAYTPWGGSPQVVSQDFWSCNYERGAGIWCELICPHFAELQQLGVTNPALEKWELVPYSFVFDWFISVGDWLTGLTAFNGVRILSAWNHSIRSDAMTWSSPPMTRVDSLYKYEQVTGQSYAWSSRHYQRTHWVPDPSSILPPVTKRDFGFDKLVTSLALLKGGHRGTVRV